MSGSVAAQAVAVLLSPILTRIYQPADFGILALYTTVLFVSVPIVSVRYDMAIVPAEDESEAFSLLLLSCAIAIVVGAASSFFLFGSLGRMFGLRELRPYFWLIPFSVTANGLYQAVRQFSIREKRFHTISASQVVQSGGSVAVQIGTALVQKSPWGLLFGQLTGLAGSTAVLGRGLGRAWQEWKKNSEGHLLGTVWTAAVLHRKNPAFLTWGGLIDAVSQRLPVLMLSGFYGPFFIGQYAIADRIIRTPISLLGQNCSPVLFQKMSDQRTKARMTMLLTKWTLGMTAVFLLPAAILFFSSRFLFPLIFGRVWAQAGVLAVYLIPIYWGSLVISPISNLLIIARRQGLFSVMHVLFLTSGFISIWFGHRMAYSAGSTLLLYSVVQFFMYFVYLAAIFVAAREVANASAPQSFVRSSEMKGSA